LSCSACRCCFGESFAEVNVALTRLDQWMPVLAVKPDGTQLFMAWYDRRNDTNNSLIDVYGRWERSPRLAATHCLDVRRRTEKLGLDDPA